MLSISLPVIYGCKKPSPPETDEPKRNTVVRYQFDPQDGQTRVLLNHDGSVSYWAPRSIADSIRVGMTASEVSGVLRADFSPEQGIYFPYYDNLLALRIDFKDGRVSKRQIRPKRGIDPV